MVRRSPISILSIFILLFSVSWMGALNRTQSHPIHGKNILLVIAHPDDEVMFFGPTLIGITNSSSENNVRVLCLSNGNADGLGHIRERELVDSLRYFGIDQVEALNHEALQDSMSAEWSLELIQQLVKERIEQYSIDTIITFDEYGISYHPNHISIHHACRSLPIDVYTLKSVPLWRKYLSIFDAINVFLSKRTGPRVIYINRPSGTILVQKAMRKGHKSQMLWFRWGWIIFSRYLIINELDLIPRI